MKRYPGKFEGCADQRLGEMLYSIVNHSGCDDEAGSCQESGWYGLIVQRKHAYIVSEDSNGFFDYEYFDSAEDASTEFYKIVYDLYEEEAIG